MNKRKVLLAIVTILVFFFSGCVSTQSKTFTGKLIDANYFSHPAYGSIKDDSVLVFEGGHVFSFLGGNFSNQEIYCLGKNNIGKNVTITYSNSQLWSFEVK